MKTKYVLGVSGGKDSAALAIYMRDNYPEIDIDYFFTDTGKELPEVYDFIGKLEGYLGKPILRLNPDRDFDYWLMYHHNFLPSIQARWCTVCMKLRPFEAWVKDFINQGFLVHSYVAIRSDEEYREGYQSRQEKLKIILPFKEDGIDKNGVMEILTNSGVGLPDYYKWRSRSGCTFCFFQRKIEWVNLLKEHPDAFEEAKNYEKTAEIHGSPFTWSEHESLVALSRPERIEQIKLDYQKRIERLKNSYQKNPLKPNDRVVDLDEIYGQSKVCLACHK